jgi:hypothetical protein
MLVRTRTAGSDEWSKAFDVPPTRTNACPTPVSVELGDGDVYDLLFYSYDSDRITVFEVESLRVHELASGLSALVICADKLGTYRAGRTGRWEFEESVQENALQVGASSAMGRLGIYFTGR